MTDPIARDKALADELLARGLVTRRQLQAAFGRVSRGEAPTLRMALERSGEVSPETWRTLENLQAKQRSQMATTSRARFNPSAAGAKREPSPSLPERPRAKAHKAPPAQKGATGRAPKPDRNNPQDINSVLDMTGQTLGEYRLEKRLGAGAMAVVYRGGHLRTGQRVAIKVLDPSAMKHPQARARFFREGKAAQSIQHPNVVRVFEVNEAAGYPFMALEFLPGGSLREKIDQKGALLGKTVKALAVRLLDALSAAHERGIVHRDLKPDNILIDTDGNPKIADFGLAHVVDASANLTASGQIMGTPAYMAPEQFEHSGVDARADLYSLGCTLYHAATGRPPFIEPTLPRLMYEHLNSPPTPIRQLNPGFPESLEEFILRLMAKRPSHRYPTASGALQGLSALTGSVPLQPTHAGPTTVPLKSRLDASQLESMEWAGRQGDEKGLPGRGRYVLTDPAETPPTGTPAAASPRGSWVTRLLLFILALILLAGLTVAIAGPKRLGQWTEGTFLAPLVERIFADSSTEDSPTAPLTPEQVRARMRTPLGVAEIWLTGLQRGDVRLMRQSTEPNSLLLSGFGPAEPPGRPGQPQGPQDGQGVLRNTPGLSFFRGLIGPLQGVGPTVRPPVAQPSSEERYVLLQPSPEGSPTMALRVSNGPHGWRVVELVMTPEWTDRDVADPDDDTITPLPGWRSITERNLARGSGQGPSEEAAALMTALQASTPAERQSAIEHAFRPAPPSFPRFPSMHNAAAVNGVADMLAPYTGAAGTVSAGSPREIARFVIPQDNANVAVVVLPFSGVSDPGFSPWGIVAWFWKPSSGEWHLFRLHETAVRID